MVYLEKKWRIEHQGFLYGAKVLFYQWNWWYANERVVPGLVINQKYGEDDGRWCFCKVSKMYGIEL